jgi:hypothetical protein
MNRIIKYVFLVVLVLCLVLSFYWSSIYEGYENTATTFSKSVNNGGGIVKTSAPPVRNQGAYGSNGIAINGYDGDGRAILSFDTTGRPIVGYNGADPIIGKPQQEKKNIPQLLNVSGISGFNNDGTPMFNVAAPSAGSTLSTMNGQIPGRYTWSKDINGTCAGGFITVDGNSCTNVCASNYNNGSQCLNQPTDSTNNRWDFIGNPDSNISGATYTGTPGCNKLKSTVCSYKDSKCVDQYGIPCDNSCCNTASSNGVQGVPLTDGITKFNF